MTALVLGASGLIGSHLLRQAQAAGHQAAGTYHAFRQDGLIPLSLAEESKVGGLLREAKPDVVLYCAGWSWVDGCEDDPARAARENTTQPARVATLAAEAGARFVYFSTSYVFDGNDGPYAEEATPRPLSVYGASKWAGEQAILTAIGDRALIARTMGVYGEEVQEKNFVYQVRRTLGAGREICVPCDQFGNTSYAGDIAAMVLELVRQGRGGVWNVAGPNPHLVRSDFARRIAKAYGLSEKLVQPTPTTALEQRAPRPRQGGLIIDKVQAGTGMVPQDWVKIP